MKIAIYFHEVNGRENLENVGGNKWQKKSKSAAELITEMDKNSQ